MLYYITVFAKFRLIHFYLLVLLINRYMIIYIYIELNNKTYKGNMNIDKNKRLNAYSYLLVYYID